MTVLFPLLAADAFWQELSPLGLGGVGGGAGLPPQRLGISDDVDNRGRRGCHGPLARQGAKAEWGGDLP